MTRINSKIVFISILCASLWLCAFFRGLAANVGPTITKIICAGEGYYVTLHIRGPGGANTLMHVRAVSSDAATASSSYDSASQSVSGIGKNPGTATITVTGAVETAEGNIPFTQMIIVNVVSCQSIEVCKGASVTIPMKGAAGASCSGAGAAASALPGLLRISGKNVGLALVSVTSADGKPIGRITVKVKNCPSRPPVIVKPSTPPPIEEGPGGVATWEETICEGETEHLLLGAGYSIDTASGDSSVASAVNAVKEGNITGVSAGTTTFDIVETARKKVELKVTVTVKKCKTKPSKEEIWVRDVDICVGEKAYLYTGYVFPKRPPRISVSMVTHKADFSWINNTMVVLGKVPGFDSIGVADARTGKPIAAIGVRVRDCSTRENFPIKENQNNTGSIDSCLVGTWRSESAGTPGLEQGGAGILLTINADGSESVDYGEMMPIRSGHMLNIWTGTARGKITTEDGKATIQSVWQSRLTHNYTGSNGQMVVNPMAMLGPGALGADPTAHYTCDEDTLTFNTTALVFKYRRQKE